MPEDPLSLAPAEIRALGAAAVERVADYYAGLRDRPLFVPTTSASLRALLDEPLPQAGADFEALLDEIDAKVVRFSRHNPHPRMFGYVASPGTPVTAIGSMVEAALNVNVTAWRS